MKHIHVIQTLVILLMLFSICVASGCTSADRSSATASSSISEEVGNGAFETKDNTDEAEESVPEIGSVIEGMDED